MAKTYFFIKNQLNKFFWTKPPLVPLTWSQLIIGQYYCKADCHSISEHTDILKLDNAVSLQPKKDFFHRFLTQNHFTLENCKPLCQTNYTTRELGSRRYFSICLVYQQIQTIELEFLQRWGAQIKVNILTVSCITYPDLHS